MTVFHFIRHAEHDLLGRELVGRRPGVHLNQTGRERAGRIAGALADVPLEAVLSGPLERARETAEAIARRRGQAVVLCPALDEVDFGEWTGRRFAELDEDRRWRHFNRYRAIAVIPGGELLLEVQARIMRLLAELGERHPAGRLALVSHGDVIRSALLHVLGMPLDFIQRLEVSPASLSTVVLDESGPRALAVNVRFDGMD
ncbi:MAG TPA: histidine phosphatase family protein [Stellaceae bacterium]